MTWVKVWDYKERMELPSFSFFPMGIAILSTKGKRKQLYKSSHQGVNCDESDGWLCLCFLATIKRMRLLPGSHIGGRKSLSLLVGRISIRTGQCFEWNKNCFQMKRRLRWKGLPACSFLSHWAACFYLGSV